MRGRERRGNGFFLSLVKIGFEKKTWVLSCVALYFLWVVSAWRERESVIVFGCGFNLELAQSRSILGSRVQTTVTLLHIKRFVVSWKRLVVTVLKRLKTSPIECQMFRRLKF